MSDPDDELAAIRRSNERWRETVVEALQAVIARLDAECVSLEESLAELRREEKLFERKRDELVSARTLSNHSEARVNELERELRVVTRDRDALIQRAVTAENTLRNHGFDMHTMQKKRSGPTSGPSGTIGFPPEYGRGFEK